MRDLLIAIICLGHAKRNGVVQNMRVWKFHAAKKRGSVEKDFTLLTCHFIRLAIREADDVLFRKSEYQLFERFYKATEAHSFKKPDEP